MEYPKGIIKRNVTKSNEIEFEESDLTLCTGAGGTELRVRAEGLFKNVSYYLNETYDWYIVEDTQGLLCLVPTKKKGGIVS